ncbi:MAG: hypothetical protein JWL61_5306 [Gemmatimonadetes bacterium]|nr:hypothetical protein [Gemmatimonadota bacterium]
MSNEAQTASTDDTEEVLESLFLEYDDLARSRPSPRRSALEQAAHLNRVQDLEDKIIAAAQAPLRAERDALSADLEKVQTELDAAALELSAIDAVLGNAIGLDGCKTRVEKVARMLRTLRERNVQPLPEGESALPPGQYRDTAGALRFDGRIDAVREIL